MSDLGWVVIYNLIVLIGIGYLMVSLSPWCFLVLLLLNPLMTYKGKGL